MSLPVNITPNGRMSLPVYIRKRLVLSDGGAVFLEETEDGVIIWTALQATARAQELAQKYTNDNDEASVEAFLNKRIEQNGE